MAALEHRERQVGFWVVSYIPFCCLVGTVVLQEVSLLIDKIHVS